MRELSLPMNSRSLQRLQQIPCVLLCLFQGTFAHAEEPSVTFKPRYELAPLSAEQRGEIKKAFFDLQPLKGSDASVSGDTQQEQLWSGTPIHLLSSIPRIEVQLVRKDPGKPEITYDFSLDFLREGLELNRPTDGARRRFPPIVAPGERKLFRLQYPDGRKLAFGMAGANRIGLDRMDVLVCPFDPFPQFNGTGTYALRSARASAKGQIQARLLSGAAEALALGAVQTAGAVPEALEVVDRSFTENPRLSMDYVPKPNAAGALSLDGTGLAAGIKITLVLHTAAANRRTETFEDTVRLEALAFTPDEELIFGDDKSFRAHGSCFVVHKESHSTVLYDVSELPKR